MMKDTQTQIKVLLSKIYELEKVRRHAVDLNIEVERVEDQLKSAENHLDESSRDIENLEGFSVKGIFYQVLGSKDEQVEKERQSYLQKALKIKELKKKIELMKYEKKLLDGKSGNLVGLKTELERLKKVREKELISSDGAKSIKLRQLLSELDLSFLMQKEINEASAAGDKCINDLNALITQLIKAKDWGNWDMMSKGRFADYKKRGAMDRARDIATHAQRSLDRFRKELQDVNSRKIHLELHIESINGFFDFFLDNIISDWIVQQKIKTSLGNVRSIKDQVQKLCDDLNDQEKETRLELKELENQKDKLLIEN